MAKTTINLKGTSGVNYNLDNIKENNRTNSDLSLVVQVHQYKKGESPNPENPKVGQIWLSQEINP